MFLHILIKRKWKLKERQEAKKEKLKVHDSFCPGIRKDFKVQFDASSNVSGLHSGGPHLESRPGHQLPLLNVTLGHEVAQAVSRLFPIAAARGSSPDQVMWVLWWKKRHWIPLPPSTSVSPDNSHSTGYSTLIVVYHSGPVLQAKQWPTCHVDAKWGIPVHLFSAVFGRTVIWSTNGDFCNGDALSVL
jgi:hypothetical protein